MSESYALNSPRSKLYNILKSGQGGNTNQLPAEMSEQEPPEEMRRADLENNNTVVQYESSENEMETVPGCPFCNIDGFQSSDVPFDLQTFHHHLSSCHPDVCNLYCAYCMEPTSARLDDLSQHIASVHKMSWAPSPASMAYLRRDQLPHRVVTCLGCGWCTFVLRANNAAQPPVSLESHLSHCPYDGGRVHLENLTPEMCTSTVTQRQLFAESIEIDRLFSEAFPLVRTKPSEVPMSPIKETHLHYRPKFGKQTKEKSLEQITPVCEPPAPAPVSAPVIEEPDTQPTLSPAPSLPQPSNGYLNEKGHSFDVPLTLPPIPPALAKSGPKSSVPTLLYVCPLCGDNALASLRERDEHLQSSHDGELVFPCQICGLAYPLYIALRRHAALKHDANYDLVRYGPPELVDTEPIECPECQLVAFTDRNVLKLHLYEMHNVLPDRAKSLIRTSLRKAHNAAIARTGRRGGRGGRREFKSSIRDRTMTARSDKNNSKPISLSRLERILGDVSGDPAPATCRLCKTPLDNAKEFRLHMELDHVDVEEECEQLGCQACGRIFFGAGGRIDLIGHLRVLHQDTDQSSALSCPHAEQKPAEKLMEDGQTVHVRPCEALFSSPRLRHIHSTTCATAHPGFACPLSIELPDAENMDVADLSEQIRAAIMETECAADREGLTILAYCCPNCSRLFAGHEAPSRYATHRQVCQVETTTSEKSPANPQAKPAGATTVLESMLRQGSDIRIN